MKCGYICSSEPHNTRLPTLYFAFTTTIVIHLRDYACDARQQWSSHRLSGSSLNNGNTMEGRIQIGTSGWHYKHWLGTFYPEGTKPSQQLELYIQSFDTVEINNSFYRVPPKETFRNWKDAVPDDFVFVVKANRLITHFKKLRNTSDDVISFLDHASELGEKLGPILFQLHPGL